MEIYALYFYHNDRLPTTLATITSSLPIYNFYLIQQDFESFDKIILVTFDRERKKFLVFKLDKKEFDVTNIHQSESFDSIQSFLQSLLPQVQRLCTLF